METTNPQPVRKNGKFSPRIPEATIKAILSDLHAGKTQRQIATNRVVSTTFVSRLRALPMREQLILEREARIFQTVFRLCLRLQQEGKKVSAHSLKPLIDKEIGKNSFSGVSETLIKRILNVFEAKRIITPRKKAGNSERPISSTEFQQLKETIAQNPAISNAEIIHGLKITRGKLDKWLKRLRDAGQLPARKRPGGKPFAKRRFLLPR